MRRRYRFKVGDVVCSRREMRNGYAVIPAGTLLTVTRRFSGYSLTAHPCTNCGVLRITLDDPDLAPTIRRMAEKGLGLCPHCGARFELPEDVKK